MRSSLFIIIFFFLTAWCSEVIKYPFEFHLDGLSATHSAKTHFQQAPMKTKGVNNVPPPFSRHKMMKIVKAAKNGVSIISNTKLPKYTYKV